MPQSAGGTNGGRSAGSVVNTTRQLSPLHPPANHTLIPTRKRGGPMGSPAALVIDVALVGQPKPARISQWHQVRVRRRPRVDQCSPADVGTEGLETLDTGGTGH